MAPHDTPAKTKLTPLTHSGAGTHLQGRGAAEALIAQGAVTLRARWLFIARLSLLAVSTLALVLYVAGTPVYIDRLYPSRTGCIGDCLTPSRVQALHALGVSITAYAVYWTAINLLFALVYFAVAALIFWRRSDDRVALLASFSLLTLGASFPTIPNVLAAAYPAWWLPVNVLNALGLPSLTVFLFLFPNGRFVPRWTRWIAAGFSALYVSGTFFPSSILSHTYWPRLLSLPIPLFVFGSLVFAQVYRYRRASTPLERQQTKWVVFGTAVALIGFLLLGFLPPALLPLFFPLQSLALLPTVFLVTSIYFFMLLIPLSIGFAILRFRLFDIDIIINRTLVYGTLTICTVAIYILIVGSLGAVFTAQGNLLISPLATGLIAVLFQPLRERLQKAVNRLMYGERDDPYGVLSHLGQRLEATLAPDAVLPTIVETIARALKLPYVALKLTREHGSTTIFAHGLPVDNLLHIPLFYQNEQVGEMFFAPRARGETFTSADRRLLGDLSRQVGVAAHAVHLTNDLQRSRERLVTAREEERRRLRRDLHDGLGPTLAGLSLKVGAIHNLLLPGQSAAEKLLAELAADIEGAVIDIRRIVYDLRPPSLDELGLIGAIRARAAQYNTQFGNLQVQVEVPERLPPLPAAIEVAVYRIVQEALNNVVRHAQARNCRIILSVSNDVCLEIIDNGRGLPEELHTGVGFIAMRERAVELGGTCEIESVQPRGTHVLAHLPLQKE